MNQAVYKRHGGEAMDSIDVHDLPEEQAQLLAAFAEFLRQSRKHATVQAPEARTTMTPPFATWPLGVKGQLTREDLYEHL
jgi:hypothetical protein